MALAGVLVSQTIEWARRRAEMREQRRRFIAERWWERRANAYSEVLAHLARVRSALLALMEEYKSMKGVSEEVILNFKSRWKDAATALGDITNQESFLLSGRARECLSEMHRTLDALQNEKDIVAGMLGTAQALKDGTARVAEAAREDLQVS